MSGKKIIVTGAAGQLGSALKKIRSEFPGFEIILLNRNSLDISQQESLKTSIDKTISAVINTAAFTAVDLAESNMVDAWQTNVSNVSSLAIHCSTLNIPLIHFSSDYVYDNGHSIPLLETDPCKPKSVYAYTKFEGEQAALYYHSKTIILRTSWVYSEYGANFVKTILKLIQEKPELNVVNDQVGAPTYAIDLARTTLQILDQVLTHSHQNHFGIFNYSNTAHISWYDFATEIAIQSNSSCKINPVPTTSFPRPANRPSYSVFDHSKIKATFGLPLIDWKKSLEICLQNLNNSHP